MNDERGKYALTFRVYSEEHPSAAVLPVIWIAFLFVHYNGFKHGTFTHHKLYHSVNEE